MQAQDQSWQGQIKARWGRLTPVQRIALGVAGIGLVAVVLYAGIWAQTPDYATLFTDLDEQDAAAVVDQLKALSIPYRLMQGGAVIQVPARQVYETRLEMAKQGLPEADTVGFELFDGGDLGSLGMTDFMQRVNYQRATEGELARTIASLEPVATARVHIVIPEPSVFISEEKEPTASIVVQLEPRAELTREQVRAVSHLVASSVEGLKPSNITLVDMQGNILSAAGEDGAVPSSLQAGNGQMEMQRAYERDLETRLQAMLDQTIGLNRSVVRVSATFNWDQKEVSSETYAPSGQGTGVLRSEETQQETLQGAGAQQGGVPGVDSNVEVPGYPIADGEAEGALQTRSNTVRNYEVSKVVQTVVQAPGSVERLSVAVLLDEKLTEVPADRVETMVAAAAGLDTSRGDSVAVELIPFGIAATGDSEVALAEAERTTTIMTLAKIAGLAIALLVLLRFARLTFRDLSRALVGEHRPQVVVVEEEELSLPAPARSLPEVAAPLVRQPELQLPEALPEAANNPMRNQLARLANEHPEMIAELVQAWLSENR